MGSGTPAETLVRWWLAGATWADASTSEPSLAIFIDSAETGGGATTIFLGELQLWRRSLHSISGLSLSIAEL